MAKKRKVSRRRQRPKASLLICSYTSPTLKLHFHVCTTSSSAYRRPKREKTLLMTCLVSRNSQNDSQYWLNDTFARVLVWVVCSGLHLLPLLRYQVPDVGFLQFQAKLKMRNKALHRAPEKGRKWMSSSLEGMSIAHAPKRPR